MVNPTSALIPNQPVAVNVPNTGTGVQLIGANPARNGLLIYNQAANTIWLGPSTVVFVAGTQQQGTFTLLTASGVLFGGLAVFAAGGFFMIPWVWNAALFAQAAAGATNVVTVLEF